MVYFESKYTITDILPEQIQNFNIKLLTEPDYGGRKILATDGHGWTRMDADLVCAIRFDARDCFMHLMWMGFFVF